MKPNLQWLSLAALGILAAAAPASLAACEGEPPIAYPQSPAGSASDTSVVPAAESAEAPSAAPQASAPPPSPCAPCGGCMAAASLDAAVVSEPSGSAAPSPASSAAPATAEVHEGAVVGSMTTKPAALAPYGVVYLEDGPKEGAPEHPSTVTVMNRQMAFIPFVAVVAAGGKVVFGNADPFPHNVFSPDNEKFNVGMIPQNAAHARTFSNPGAYSLLCNLHPGMLGYVLVTPSPWFARTDAKGKFALKHVPPGTYKVTGWAPRQTPVTESITVTDGDATLNFDLHR